jgi:Tfp pilus assembly protein PilV
MRQGDPQWNVGAIEKWGNEIFNTPAVQHSNTQIMPTKLVRRRSRSKYAFALYEVLLGVAIFAIGVISLGRAVQNCLNASSISAEENVVRQILSDRMAVVQAAKGVPEAEKEFKINTGYGRVILTQKTADAALTEPDNTIITGINLVTLTARWEHAGVPQSKQIQFYVYRSELS